MSTQTIEKEMMKLQAHYINYIESISDLPHLSLVLKLKQLEVQFDRSFYNREGAHVEFREEAGPDTEVFVKPEIEVPLITDIYPTLLDIQEAMVYEKILTASIDMIEAKVQEDVTLYNEAIVRLTAMSMDTDIQEAMNNVIISFNLEL